MHGAFLYWVWLLPLAWPLAVILLMPVFLADEWKFLHRERIVDMVCVVGIRTTALLLSGLAVWLPTLVALDMALWRRRAEFHRLARGILYSMAWWFWAAVFFGGIGNWMIGYVWHRSMLRSLISQGVESGWLPDFTLSNMDWGSVPWRGGFSGYWPQQTVPWIAWIAAVIATLQFVTLFRLAKRPAGGSDATTSLWRHPRRIIICGWLIAAYLLLFDRHVQLRFHLVLAADEWKWLCNWANALFRGEYPFVTGD